MSETKNFKRAALVLSVVTGLLFLWFAFQQIIIVLGLVVYCIALVFEYGISLQNQVDETL